MKLLFPEPVTPMTAMKMSLWIFTDFPPCVSESEEKYLCVRRKYLLGS
jgi:hypothetical protein